MKGPPLPGLACISARCATGSRRNLCVALLFSLFIPIGVIEGGLLHLRS